MPVAAILPELLAVIEHGDCILSAPPGAGKSTFLPLKLLSLPCFANKQILLLQPRQVAVRAIANFLATSLGEKVGHRVGYQMRGESAISASTRLCVITEGLLIAKLQTDPALSEVGLIIFDEFHERSVQSDIALGLSLEVQRGLRDDLRLLVMSATLNTNELATLMPTAKQLASTGRSYPISYLYKPIKATSIVAQKMAKRPLGSASGDSGFVTAVVNAVVEAHTQYSGNILVFLSGAGLINKVKAALDRLTFCDSTSETVVAPLYGALTQKQQQQAIEVPPPGTRKIVLATNIAETSLTIDGVNIVIDSGREKTQRFVVARKLNQLSEQFISKASSIQRAGRAGRQQAGICYRLWSQEQQQFLQENTPAQITQVDISQTLLVLLEWGSSFDELPLIDRPIKAQVDYARELLMQLGLLNPSGYISPKGKKASQFNTHPRLARMLTDATTHANRSLALLSAIVVAAIDAKSLSTLAGSIDIVAQCRYVIGQFAGASQPKGMAELRKDINRMITQLGIVGVGTNELSTLGKLPDLSGLIANVLMSAFPDKIGRKRKLEGYVLADGTGAEFMGEDECSSPEWIIATHSQLTHKTNGLIRQYCEIPQGSLTHYLDANTQTGMQQYWDESLAKVVAKEVSKLGAIELSSQACRLHTNAQTAALMIKQVRKRGLYSLLGKANVLLSRVRLAKHLDTNNSLELPDVSPESLLETLEIWLIPYLSNISTWQQLEQIHWFEVINALLRYSQQQYLVENFPIYYVAPTGNQHKLDYSEDGKVTLAIRIQELYGLSTHPTIGKGKLPITLSLLSPGHREIQKTADLATFWTGSYFAVQKEMKGRYPKHFWPDKPEAAIATTKTKKNMGT